MVLSHRADTVDVSIRMELASCLAPMALWAAPTETPIFLSWRASPWKSPGSQRSVALADCNLLVSVPSLAIPGLCSWFAHVHLGRGRGRLLSTMLIPGTPCSDSRQNPYCTAGLVILPLENRLGSRWTTHQTTRRTSDPRAWRPPTASTNVVLYSGQQQKSG